MKKLIYIILGFIIGAVLTYYYCPRPSDNMQAMETKIIKPKGVISVKDAIALNDNWTNEREKANDSAAKKFGRKKDNRSTWWSIDDIENYLAYAKHKSDSLGYTMTGIQIYLGVYGKNAGQRKKNLTTMFIAPTGDKSVSKGSMNPFNTVTLGGNPPIPPLNNGSGGSGNFPQ